MKYNRISSTKKFMKKIRAKIIGYCNYYVVMSIRRMNNTRKSVDILGLLI